MFVSHIECTVCGRRHEAGQLLTVCQDCGQMLAVRYDLPRAAAAVTPESLKSRPPGMYRFRELVPLDAAEEPVTLGEGGTPLLALPRLAAHLGLRHLWAKDEGQNPTGTFKARGLGMAITKARALGVRGLMIPSAGNAGGAAAVYGARAGLPVAVVVPRDTPEAAIAEAALAGAHVFTSDGTIATAGRASASVAPALGWFDLATLKEPYRLEGKKTMGLELAEQLGWDAPDVLVYPTGGGTGLVGIWKAYEELGEMGWVKAGQPRFVAVQASGCAPMVRAFEAGTEHAPRWEDAHTIASGIRVPQAIGDFLILRAVRESKGFAIAVTDENISAALDEVSREEGLLLCPEGAATYAAYKQSLADGRVAKNDRVMLFNCATGLKYPLPPVTRTLDRHQPIDYAKL